MNVTIRPCTLRGRVQAPPSKSYAHRMLICAALAEGESRIHGISGSEDMYATMECVEALGGATAREGDTVTVTGTLKNYKGTVEFDAGCTLVEVQK